MKTKKAKKAPRRAKMARGGKQYDNTNSGVLFKNKDKQSAKHPDFKGSINVGGVEYWLSAWKNESDKGNYLKLAVTEKKAAGSDEAKKAPSKEPAKKQAASEDEWD